MTKKAPPEIETTATPVNDWLFDGPASGGELVKVDETLAEAKTKQLGEIEQQLLDRSVEVLDGALAFTELELGAGGEVFMPPEWVEKYGAEAANRRFVAAKAAMLSAKEAPVGIMVAKSLATGIIKARSIQKGGSVSVNVAVLVQQPQADYPVIQVKEDDS